MNLSPVGNRILVKQLKASTHSPGGITLPDQAQEAPKRGVILAVGNIDSKKYGSLRDGNEIFFAAYAGVKIEFEGEEYINLKDEEVIARIVK